MWAVTLVCAGFIVLLLAGVALLCGAAGRAALLPAEDSRPLVRSTRRSGQHALGSFFLLMACGLACLISHAHWLQFVIPWIALSAAWTFSGNASQANKGLESLRLEQEQDATGVGLSRSN